MATLRFSLLKLQEKNKTLSIKYCYGNNRTAGIFSDAQGEAMKANIKRELVNCKYFCVSSDVSTDCSVKENALVYLFYLKNC